MERKISLWLDCVTKCALAFGLDNLGQDWDEDRNVVNVGNKFNDEQEAGWSC